MASQITEMAGDVVECCTLSKRVALRLADEVADNAGGQHLPERVSSVSFGEGVYRVFGDHRNFLAFPQHLHRMVSFFSWNGAAI